MFVNSPQTTARSATPVTAEDAAQPTRHIQQLRQVTTSPVTAPDHLPADNAPQPSCRYQSDAPAPSVQVSEASFGETQRAADTFYEDISGHLVSAGAAARLRLRQTKHIAHYIKAALYYSRPLGRYFIAWDNQRPVGILLLDENKNVHRYPYIPFMATHPAYKGVGRALLEAAVKNNPGLSALADNHNARQFFRHMGFIRTEDQMLTLECRQLTSRSTTSASP